MRDRLNEIVKFREPFRPYAASVLAEHVQEYFELTVDDPFMLVVAPIWPERRESIASVCHVDGTCRVQTVRPDHDGQFRTLIESFFAITDLPLVLNTSFNIRGEPIVEAPGDAMDCFLASNIDVLYVEGWRITKASVASTCTPGTLLPLLNNSLSIGTIVSSVDGIALEPEHYAQTRTGHRVPISHDDLLFLCAIDGKRTVDDIGRMLRGLASTDGETSFASLQRRGFVSFGFHGEDREEG